MVLAHFSSKPIAIRYIYMIIIGELRFDWAPDKARKNLRKHGVALEEACTIFGDENGILIHDPDHSHTEDRYLLLGMSAKTRLLVVSHTYRDEDRMIRIISAWIAARKERQQYGRMKLP